MPTKTLQSEEQIVSIAHKEAKGQDHVPDLDYDEKELTYIEGLRLRLAKARDQRDTYHDEFDGMTYIEWCESNRKLANTYIKPRVNKEDSNYVSGVVRQKLLALLAAVNNLELFPEVSAFDDDDREIPEVGQGLEDMIWKTEELDGDEEKQLLRQYTLLEQGTVFVQESWIEKFKFEKEFTSEFDGKLSSAKWNKRLKKVFVGATRDIIQGENVYLGDITQFDVKKQPFIFTVEHRSYDDAKLIYGNWERWNKVPKERTSFSNEGEQTKNTLYNQNWHLTSVKKGQVEIIKYQDKPNNEFQILINGIPMLPMGFPMPWKYGEYSLAMQVYSIISPFFAYGKSLPAMLRPQAAVWDEMQRLMVLKTQKSFKPPMANLTGKVLSSRVLMPGVMTYGVNPDQLKLMDPEGSKGLTNNEAAAMKIIQDNIDRLSVDPTFAGQNPEGNPTATQIIEVQRQARMVLGLTIFVCSLLEKKLGELRLLNIMENWFEPEDEVVDRARNLLTDQYRQFARPAPIEGEGMGQRITRLDTQEQKPFDVFREEELVKRKTGTPTRINVLNPDAIKQLKLKWYITVTPKEKKSSPTNRLMFREFMADLQLFAPLGNINWGYVEERFAINWEENPDKLFTQTQGMQPMVPGQEPPQAGEGVGDRLSKSAMLGPEGARPGLSVKTPTV